MAAHTQFGAATAMQMLCPQHHTYASMHCAHSRYINAKSKHVLFTGSLQYPRVQAQ